MTHNCDTGREQHIRHLTQYRESLAADYLTSMHYGNYDMAAVYERAMREVDAELSRAIEIEKAADKVFARHDGALRRLAGTNEKQTEGAAN